MSEITSAPASSTASAISVMLVTFGESFAITGFSDAAATARTTAAAAWGSVPKTMPPSLTFGQEILISSAATPATLSRAASAA